MTPPQRLMFENPSFHAWGDGTPAKGSVETEVPDFLADHLAPGIHTLETGAGQTTVVFALAGARHIGIAPRREQAERIRAYCRELGVDGYRMPSVRILHDFLMGEDEWELVEIVGRTSFFRRLRETVIANDCQGQRTRTVPC